MKFTLPVFVLAALSLADKQGDYDAIASAVKPFVKQAKCGLPCVIGALGKARSRKAGEPVTETLCNKGNRRKVTSEADMCLGRNCHLSGIARTYAFPASLAAMLTTCPSDYQYWAGLRVQASRAP